MLVIYGIVAGLGYYYFGDAASTLITDDLSLNSPFTGHSVRSASSYVLKLICVHMSSAGSCFHVPLQM